MEPISEEYIMSVVTKVKQILNFTDVHYTLRKFESIAQNYFGVIIPVTITGKDSEKDMTIDLVLKLAPTDERYRVSGAVSTMFAREIYVYSIILQKYAEIQEKLPSNSKYVIPKCYYISKEYCKEAIVMQNMCQEGYMPYTQQPFLDYDHITVSLKALANFHALSFNLEEKNLNIYEEAKKICIPLTEKTNKRFMEILVDRLSKAIQIFLDTKYSKLLEEFKQNCTKYVEAAAYSAEKLCICHGDIWKENILFKYENEIPVAVCLIDYQTTRMSSPVFDVLYLIISSTNSKLRRDHYEQLLDIYYNTFDEVLRNVGMDSSKVYSKLMFDNDLKIVGPACFIIANTALWLSNGLQEEGHVRSKQVWITPEEKVIAANKYKNIIQDILEDLDSYGYLPTVST